MGIAYMIGQYDYRLVALSIVVAILASYTAIDMASRVRVADTRRVRTWLVAGALSLGTGIWAMHFVGMLAFDLPIEMGYDIGLTALSWVMAVLASIIALHLASRPNLSRYRLWLGAVFMASGIAGMHYTGMYAMRMEPGIVYDPVWVSISLLIALGASAAALWVAFHLQQRKHGVLIQLGASIIMGIAIAGMHYSAMAGANFPLGGTCGAALTGINAPWLAALVGASSILFLGTALTATTLDRHHEGRTAQLLKSLQRTNVQLRHATLHDPLTDLPNRNLLHERIDQALRRWATAQTRFAVLYIDLDGFKVINDNLGHHTGDDLLKRAATAMAGVVRHSDTLARVGGDEFVLVLDHLGDDQAVKSACGKLLAAIGSVRVGATSLAASIGVAVCPEDGYGLSPLITAADMAMYAAKTSGKNRYQRYHAAMSTTIAADFQVQEDLRLAIDAGDLVVHYQPKYNPRTRAIVGAEALVRWQHPEKGIIPPDRFIAVAEHCGLIEALESNVLASVCAHIREWLDSGLDVPRIAVNLSPLRIRDDDLPRRVRTCLNEHGVQARYLMCEVTESLAMQEILRAAETLRWFRAMGIGVALDDFGTGHSSLAHLRDLPVDMLKIDRSFIAALNPKDPDQGKIVRAIIDMAHALSLHVVAEGVETEEQLAYLNQFKCDEVQGYLLSRPVPAEDFLELISLEHVEQGIVVFGSRSR